MTPIVMDAGRCDLSRLFADLGFTRGAEIGVWTGKFSARLCADNPALHLLCVDPWMAYGAYRDSRNSSAVLDGAYREAVARLSAYSCTLVRKMSLVAAADVPDGSLDFVYLDANHGGTFVAADLHAWVPKVRSGGIVSGHDYLERATHPHIQVKAAVDRYVQDRGLGPLTVWARDSVPSFSWVQP